ncbi:MAG: SRPBCC family protein [Sporichthyaceae bacterium]
MRARTVAALLAAGATGYALTVQGKLTLDTGVGRRFRPLSCPPVEVAAPRDVVFDVLTAPYAVRQSRAMAEKVQVLERGSDMLLAAHRTPVRAGLVATTVETVRFSRPERIEFRLLRGPVPYVVEAFDLEELDAVTDPDGTAPSRTLVTYSGQLGTDFWGLGGWWGALVSASWESTVAASLAAARVEAERRFQSRPLSS